jgi:endonuclease III
MAARSKKSQLAGLLDQLESAYGPLVPTENPIEAGLMTLLAEHAPDLSVVQTRQALREWFVDWNEMRVADPWDVSKVVASGGHAGARKFARAALRLLKATHIALNRCSFDRALADPELDLDALVDKMRNVPAHTKAVVKAALAGEGEWRPDKEISKLVQKLGLVAKTTSLNKVAKGLEAIADEADRLRAHYLLTRYAHRAADSADPLATKPAKKPAKKAAKKATKTAVKKVATKATKKTSK